VKSRKVYEAIELFLRIPEQDKRERNLKAFLYGWRDSEWLSIDQDVSKPSFDQDLPWLPVILLELNSEM